VLAIRASGLTPLEAIIAGPDGEAGATSFGWQPPFPPLGPLVRRRTWAEAVTDRIAGQAYRVLEPEERTELADLLDAALDLSAALVPVSPVPEWVPGGAAASGGLNAGPFGGPGPRGGGSGPHGGGPGPRGGAGPLGGGPRLRPAG
jgi:hypothetical protein